MSFTMGPIFIDDVTIVAYANNLPILVVARNEEELIYKVNYPIEEMCLAG